jgi:hypothetical protein
MGKRLLTSAAWVCLAACASNGDPGSSSLITTYEEPPGTNCPAGGIRMDHGVDRDDNGLLEGTEVVGTAYVCDGRTGNMGDMGTAGLRSLVAVVNEPAGANCATGGSRVNTGIDDNNDGNLGAGEIDGSAYVCNGATGTAGTNGRPSLLDIDPATVGACPNGGQTIAHGVDDNGNGTLDTGEVDGSASVCNGATPTAEVAALDARLDVLEVRRPRTAVIQNAVTPAVVRSSEAWIGSVTRPVYGTATVNFAAGTFTSAPTCFASLVTYPGGNGAGTISITDTTASYVTTMAVCTGPTCTGQWDVLFTLLCLP